MFTRAYDVINVLNNGAMSTLKQEDFNTTSLSDNFLNAKNINGAIRMIFQVPTQSSFYPPFHVWRLPSNNGYLFLGESIILPDEDTSIPSYEDYASNYKLSGWTLASSDYDIIYNSPYSRTIKIKLQNTSSALKTVTGINVIYTSTIQTRYNDNSGNTDTFLVLREHFDTPVEVPANGIIELALTINATRLGTNINASAS